MKIPTYESQVSPTETSSMPFSLPGEKRRAIIGEFVPATGLGNIATALSDISKKIMEAEQLEQFNDSKDIRDKKVSALIQEQAEDKTGEWSNLTVEAQQEKFRQRYADILDEARENLKDGVAKKQFEVYAKAHEIEELSTIKHNAWLTVNSRIKAKTNNKIDELEKRGQIEFDDKAIKEIEALVDANVTAKIYTPDEGRIKVVKARKNIATGRTMRIVYANPMEALKKMNASRIPDESKRVPFPGFDSLDEKEQVGWMIYAKNAMIAGDAARNKINRENEKAEKKKLASQDFEVLINYHKGKYKNEDGTPDINKLHELATSRYISQGMYDKIYKDMKNPKKIVDNPTVRVGLFDRLHAHGDIAEDAKKAFVAGDISYATYFSLTDKNSIQMEKEGEEYIYTNFKMQSEEAKFPNTPKYLLFVETKSRAIEYYHTLRRNGIAPLDAAKTAVLKFRDKDDITYYDMDVINKDEAAFKAKLAADRKGKNPKDFKISEDEEHDKLKEISDRKKKSNLYHGFIKTYKE